MPTALRSRLASFGRHLSSMDDQPLGKAALAIVILLDVFIFFSIFAGLDRHTGQLTDPYDYIPPACREIVISGEWNKANRLERLAGLVQTRVSLDEIREPPRQLHPICAPLIGEIDEIAGHKPLTNAFLAYGRLSREARDVREKISDLKGPFDTALMESLARQEGRQIQALAAGEELAKETAKLDSMLRILSASQAQLEQDVRVSNLWKTIDNLSNATREQLREDLKRLTFWHPVKRVGMDLAFLLPLLVVLALWNSSSIRGKRGAQILVSSHLLVVTALPVLLKLGQLVYEIIPKRILQKVIALLESLRLVALWHYLMMAVAIVVALWLIYIFQRKLFSREKLIAKRIARGMCQECGQPLAPGSNVCPLCGFNQYRTCGNCGKPTFVFGRFCRACGQA